MRGKYRLHKQLGVLLPMNFGGSATPGTLHMPFPGIYHIIHQGGGGGGSGGNTAAEFTAQGNGGYGSAVVDVKLSFRQSAFRTGGNAGSGGAPGTPGNSGVVSHLSDGQSATYAWGGPGGSGYGGAPPTGNGGAGGASRAYGGNGGWGSLTRYVLVG